MAHSFGANPWIMPLPELDADYWRDRYTDGSDSWDVGSITTPLKEYFLQLTDKSLRINN